MISVLSAAAVLTREACRWWRATGSGA